MRKDPARQRPFNPDPMIPTTETGARHRTAERVAVETGELVIAISQRRNVITLYKGNQKHVLREVGTVLAKANQALQTLEKYKSVLEQALINLSALEFEDLVALVDVCTVVQRGAMVLRIAQEIEVYIYELGSEGRLVNMQLEELMYDVEDEEVLVLKDYLPDPDQEQVEKVRAELATWTYEELLDLDAIARAMGFTGMTSLDISVVPRGYRILRKIPRLPMPVIENLVRKFKELQNIVGATIEDLDAVEGSVKSGPNPSGRLAPLQEQVLLDRHI